MVDLRSFMRQLPSFCTAIELAELQLKDRERQRSMLLTLLSFLAMSNGWTAPDKRIVVVEHWRLFPEAWSSVGMCKLWKVMSIPLDCGELLASGIPTAFMQAILAVDISNTQDWPGGGACSSESLTWLEWPRRSPWQAKLVGRILPTTLLGRAGTRQ